MKNQQQKKKKTPDQRVFVFECTFFDEFGDENYSKKFSKEVKTERVENFNHHVFLQA